MAESVTPKPMPVTSMPDRVTPNEQHGELKDMRAGVKFGKMQVTNGRPPKGGK
jgi:hypothetical protein